jgi:multiple sugar transport system ATP-binding protein
MPRITFEQVGKAYGEGRHGPRWALRELDLEVASGEYLVLLGPSGAGKTTALRLVAGLEAPSTGRILFDGSDVTAVPPERREVGLVFQHGALFPHLTVRENLSLRLRLQGLPRAEIQRRTEALAELLSMTGWLERLPGELSGGERQRVALGRALAGRPSVLLLDEPLAALDAPLRRQLAGELRRAHRRHGTTTIHVTHDQSEALRLGDRVAVLQAGVLEQVATPRALYALPRNRFVAGFVGSPPMNFCEGTLHRQGGACRFVPRGQEFATVEIAVPSEIAGRLPVGEGLPLTLGIRAEALAWHRESPGETETAAGPCWAAEVEWVGTGDADMGVDVELRIGSEIWIARWPREQNLQPGDRVTVVVPLDRACWFDTRSGQSVLGLTPEGTGSQAAGKAQMKGVAGGPPVAR